MSYIDQLIEENCVNDQDFAEAFTEESERLDVAVALMQMRKEEGLTQKQLAERANKPQSTIARIENGTLNPSLKVLGEIARGAGRRLEINFAR